MCEAKPPAVTKKHLLSIPSKSVIRLTDAQARGLLDDSEFSSAEKQEIQAWLLGAPCFHFYPLGLHLTIDYAGEQPLTFPARES